ncbi:unnamed protein product [Heterotrigona itama]|uniref:Uncharacterized protein n=1 Tax=Heterotrigona itama TaxID=395501 RepID=A0A6V7H3Z2_9HYME|nr:unnamed protein product [Heterotrigona itama]
MSCSEQDCSLCRCLITYVRGLSIGSQSGIAAILAMDSPDASSRPIGRPSGDLEKRGGEEGGRWRGGFFPAEAEDEDCWFCRGREYRSGECPTAAKGGCCFLRTGRSCPRAPIVRNNAIDSPSTLTRKSKLRSTRTQPLNSFSIANQRKHVRLGMKRVSKPIRFITLSVFSSAAESCILSLNLFV